jgi:hypothetical protein
VHAPTYLFLIPGAALFGLGALVMLTVMARLEALGRTWDLHTLLAGALLVVVGAQVVGMGLCARAYGVYHLGERDDWFERASARVRLEHGLLLGGATLLAGLTLCVLIATIWIGRGFGRLSEERLAVVAAVLVTVGLQIIFSSFLLSILGLRRGEL